MSETIRINNRNWIYPDELTMVASRSGGPGGQHRDKSSTRVQLRFNVPGARGLSQTSKQRILRKLAARITQEGDLVVSSDRTRSQHQNREDCRNRLEELVREALTVRKPRRKTQPSREARRKRIERKRRRGKVKELRRRPARDD